MRIDDNDPLAARALGELGYPPAFSPAASLVAAATDLNPATRQAQQ